MKIKSIYLVLFLVLALFIISACQQGVGQKISGENKLYTLNDNKVIVKEGAKISSNDDGTLTVMGENEEDVVYIRCETRSGSSCTYANGRCELKLLGGNAASCGCSVEGKRGCQIIVDDD